MKSPGPDDLSLHDVWTLLWEERFRIAALTALFTALAACAYVVFPTWYEASVEMSVVSQNGDHLGGSASTLSQLGGLASLVGLSGAGDSSKAESTAVLQSELLTEKYIQDNNLLPVLFASKWDSETKRWKVVNPTKVPTLWKANEYFRTSVRSVTEDARTGLTKLTIRWRDPKIAAKWANELVKNADDNLRNKAIQESSRNIAFLNDQAQKTSVVEMQKAIYSLLENETKKMMLAHGGDNYAFKVIDPATAPERPSTAGPIVWMVSGMFGGLLIAITFAFVRRGLRANLSASHG